MNTPEVYERQALEELEKANGKLAGLSEWHVARAQVYATLAVAAATSRGTDEA